jgi:hypothetical protein
VLALLAAYVRVLGRLVGIEAPVGPMGAPARMLVLAIGTIVNEFEAQALMGSTGPLAHLH